MLRRIRGLSPYPGGTLLLFIIIACLIASGDVVRAEIEKLTLFQKTGRAPLVVLADVIEGEDRLAVIRTREIIQCSIPERPGKEFRIAFRLDSFLRKPWEDRITFLKGEEVVLFLRKFTKDDGQQPDSDIYTLMWGAEGKFLLPPEGSAAYVEAVRRFGRIAGEKDPFAQEDMILEGIGSENPFIVEASFEEALRQHLGTLSLLPSLIGYFKHPRDGFRILAMRLIGQLIEDARIAEREIPSLEALADLVRGRAALDASAPLRVEAVTLIGVLRGEGSRSLLERLSREDPSQDVRYAASRVLLTWQSPR